ncbi:MAG: hypothetical protein U0792_17465 [Gemmataceae bacterium]
MKERKKSRAPCLRIEHLEDREVPSASPITETFDTTATPALPSGWTRWSSDGTPVFTTAAGQGVASSIGLVTNATSGTSALTWSTQAVSQNDGVAATLWADSLIRSFVFTRGTNLGTKTPSYLAAVVTRGLHVELWEVTNGNVRVLGWIDCPPAAYLSNRWVRVSLVPTGNDVTVQITRADTGQYLNAFGFWQTLPAMVLTAKTSLTTGTGYAGIGRAAAYSGTAKLDTFSILPASDAPPALSSGGVKETFDITSPGAIPSGWQSWRGGAAGDFGVTSAIALSVSNGFASTGGSTTTSRAWNTANLGADVDASAAVYVDGIIPARVFVRGSGLNTATPTFYAASITRGLNVSLLRSVNGAETVLGTIKSSDYVSSKWIRVRVIANGSRLQVSISRADTGQWLTPMACGPTRQTLHSKRQDSSITAAGAAGVARAAPPTRAPSRSMTSRRHRPGPSFIPM